MNVLTEKHLADKAAERASWEPGRAGEALASLVREISSRLSRGEAVTFRSFGDIVPLGPDGQPGAAGTWLLPSPEAVSALREAVDCKEAEAERFLDGFLHVVRECLLQGDRVEIEGLFAFAAEEGAAGDGERTLSFAPSDELAASLPPGGSLRFQPDGALRRQLAGGRATSILLLVPERDFFVETLEFHFQRAGWQVETFTDTGKVLEKIEAHGEAYMALLDAKVPDHQSLAESIKCTLPTSLVPILSIHPASDDPKKTEGFRICSDQMIFEPFEVKSLLDKADNELARVAEEESIFRQEVRFQFSTTEDHVNRANQVAARLFEQSGLSDEGQVALSAAFREAVGNAAQHGNRHRRDKVIEVLYLLDDEKITANVTDEGKGFEHHLYTQRGATGDALGAARERHRMGKLGGLGIMLMMKCTDKLEYNEVGNSVTLTKMISPPPGE